MTNEAFEKLSADLMAECLATLNKKGPEYSGTEDRLANFKRIAEEEQTDPLTVCRIYQRKHIDAVNTFVKTLQEKGYHEAEKHLSEPIKGRIVDVINYYILLYALINENARVAVFESPEKRDCEHCSIGKKSDVISTGHGKIGIKIECAFTACCNANNGYQEFKK